MAVGISAKLPLAYTKADGPYLLTKDLTENTKQKLKTLIFTNPGERVMNVDFGVGFSALLFENATDSVLEDLRERLFTQVDKYLPFGLTSPSSNQKVCPLNFSFLPIIKVFHISLL